MEFVIQGSEAFTKVSSFKLQVLRYITAMGINALYTDSDVILYKNPFSYISRFEFQYMVFQRDRSICTGFFFIRACKMSLKLLDYAVECIKQNKTGDQKSMVDSYRYYNITPDLLPESLFSSGKIFFQKYQYSWDLNSSDLYMMHNNYVRGRECKKLRMLELGYLNSTKDSEFTKYITANFLSDNTTILEEQLSALVNIANRLERVLILPPIPCDLGKGYCTITNIRCNQWMYLLSKLKYGYRESSFIGKPQIPESLKQSLSNQQFIEFSYHCNEVFKQSVVMFPPRELYHNEVVCHRCFSSFKDCVVNYFSGKSEVSLVSIII